MNNYLKYVALVAMSAGVASASFSVKGQTSTGRFTIRMPHGPVVMEIGRQPAADKGNKAEIQKQNTADKHEDKNKKDNNKENKRVNKNDNKSDNKGENKVPESPSVSVMPINNNEVSVPPTPPEGSTTGLVYDGNEKTLKYGEHTYKFVKVNSRTLNMGATEEQGIIEEEEGERGVRTTETPRHSVTLFTYYLGSTEVPQWLWTAVMGNNPSSNVGDYNPVENVSWEDCNAFVRKLSDSVGRTIGMPTEAQMELALRNGEAENKNKFGTPQPLDDVAWYTENSDGRTHRIGLKKPNDLGLYDIIGNVGEWCVDWYGVYPNQSVTAPKGPDSGTLRVYRSAPYNSPAEDCRTAKRFAEDPDFKSPTVGLRLVLK